MPLTPEPEVYVGGRPLSSLVRSHGELKIGWRWSQGPGGCFDATFTVTVARGVRVPLLETDGTSVAIRQNLTTVWLGEVEDYDRNTGQVVAFGLSRRAVDAAALGSNGATTAVPDTAIDQGIARGALPWRRVQSFGSQPFTDPNQAAAPIEVADLLTASTRAATPGGAWGVDQRGTVYSTGTPTAPSLVVMPDSGELGFTRERQAGSIVGRYKVDANTYANVRVGTQHPEVCVSLQAFGVITQTRAVQIITAMLADLQAVQGWTNSLELDRFQLRTRGGAPVGLGQIRADGFTSLRLDGVRAPDGRTPYTDVQIGETQWTPANGLVVASPVGLVSRDLASVIEDAGGELLSGL
jgi:hypothetical protein